MTSPSVVRRAGQDDEREVWRLFRMLHSENAMFPISEAKVQFYLDRLLRPNEISTTDTGPRGFIGVIGPVGALEACIMLTLGTVWYSEEWTLDEHLNFVDPRFRCADHARSLIMYAKDCAERIGIKLVIGVLSTHRTAAKTRLYERYLAPVGAFFMHPAPPEQMIAPRKIVVQRTRSRNKARTASWRDPSAASGS